MIPFLPGRGSCFISNGNAPLSQRHLHNLLSLPNLHPLAIRCQHLLLTIPLRTYLNISISLSPSLELRHLQFPPNHSNRGQNHEHGHKTVELTSQEGNGRHFAQHSGQRNAIISRLGQLEREKEQPGGLEEA